MTTFLKHPFELCFDREIKTRLNLICLYGIKDAQAFSTVTFPRNHIEEDKDELKLLMELDDRFTDVSDYSHWSLR